jgi:hypothetical protein
LFDSPVVLFHSIIQIFARPYLYVPRQLAAFFPFGNGAVGGGLGIQRDFGRDSLIPHRLAEKGFGRIPVPPATKMKLHGLADLVDGSIQVHPLASNLPVCFIHSPRSSDWASVALPAFLELGRVMLDPTKNGGGGHRQAVLTPDGYQIARA